MILIGFNMSIEQKDVPSNAVERRHWAIYRLKIKGQSLTSVARDNDVSPVTLRQAFERPYPKMERAIAKALDVEVGTLFPERYGEDGRRLGVFRATRQ